MLYARDFSLKHTVESGQPLAFCSDYVPGRIQDRLRYPTSKGTISLSHNKYTRSLKVTFSGDYTDREAEHEVSVRLGLNHNIKEIYEAIGTDRFIGSSIKQLYGMRITKSEPWEAALCFVVSQFNNMKRIRGTIKSMIGTFGEEDRNGERMFPQPDAIADASVGSIRACGTGFRDRYVKHVAEQFCSGFNPESLYGMKYLDAKERLMELDGIGDKVADCILLFGYNKFESFPIDVWVKRVVERAYFNGRKKRIRQIHDFSVERWGKYGGYAQQYIFWYGREKYRS